MSKYTEAEIVRARARYRPPRITILFVGESPPSNGNFFYCGNNELLRHMRSAAGLASDSDDDFLQSFTARGWYLDDLVPTPVDHLPRSERVRICWNARHDLAARIAEYHPLAIVSVLRRIRHAVEAAADEADSSAPRYAVPFPGHGHQQRFREEVAHILSKSPLPQSKEPTTENSFSLTYVPFLFSNPSQTDSGMQGRNRLPGCCEGYQ